MTAQKINSRFAIAAIIVMALVFRLLFLTSVANPVYDEIVNTKAAQNYTERGFSSPGSWYQPYLANILMYASMGILGDNALGWRLPSAIYSVISIYLVYLLSLALFQSDKIAVMAAFLIAIDPIHLSMSRNAIGEPPAQVFTILSLYFAIRYTRNLKPWNLVIAGIAAGLCGGIKWHGAFNLIALLAISLTTLFRSGERMSRRVAELTLIFSALVVLPAAVYLLSFYPWFGLGYSLQDFVELQVDMYVLQNAFPAESYKFMSGLNMKASSWFWDPAIVGIKIPNPSYSVAALYMGNPFIWLLTIPAIGLACYKCIARKSFSLAVVIGAFSMQYIPLLLIRRPIFVHSIMPVLPVMAISIAHFLNYLSERTKKPGVIYGYLAANLLLVSYMYPFITVHPISHELYNNFYSWLDLFWHIQK